MVPKSPAPWPRCAVGELRARRGGGWSRSAPASRWRRRRSCRRRCLPCRRSRRCCASTQLMARKGRFVPASCRSQVRAAVGRCGRCGRARRPSSRRGRSAKQVPKRFCRTSRSATGSAPATRRRREPASSATSDATAMPERPRGAREHALARGLQPGGGIYRTVSWAAVPDGRDGRASTGWARPDDSRGGLAGV